MDGKATRCARITASFNRTQEWVRINLGIESGAMTDRTTIDRTSHLELEHHEKTFLDSNELIINMGRSIPPLTEWVAGHAVKLERRKKFWARSA